MLETIVVIENPSYGFVFEANSFAFTFIFYLIYFCFRLFKMFVYNLFNTDRDGYR